MQNRGRRPARRLEHFAHFADFACRARLLDDAPGRNIRGMFISKRNRCARRATNLRRIDMTKEGGDPVRLRCEITALP